MGMAAGLVGWKEKQGSGRVMPPASFQRIVSDTMGKYDISRERAERIVGDLYWRTAKEKYSKKKEGK